MEKSLSDADLKRLNPSLNVILYSELKNMTPLDVLSKLPLAILYQSTETTGHWTLLLQHYDGIEFFDPYGYKPDQEFSFLKYKQPHYIAKLLYILHLNNHKIHYNEYQFQKMMPGINTCGRHIINRMYYRNMNIDQYKNIMDRVAYNGDYDSVVVQNT